MQNTYTVTGTLLDGQTVKLDEELPLTQRRVRLVVEPLSPETKRGYMDVMRDIREQQRARGHKPRSKEVVDAHLATERDSWGE